MGYPPRDWGRLPRPTEQHTSASTHRAPALTIAIGLLLAIAFHLWLDRRILTGGAPSEAAAGRGVAR